jgi:hypothetical protein
MAIHRPQSAFSRHTVRTLERARVREVWVGGVPSSWGTVVGSWAQPNIPSGWIN